MPKDEIAKLRSILRDISPSEAGDDAVKLEFVADAAKEIGLPYMVFLVLALGTDCKCEWRPMEKVAWRFHLRFRGEPLLVEHAKFGLRIAASQGADAPVADFVKVLKRAFPHSDRVLQPMVEEQVKQGHVTVPNRHHLLRERYEFFREKARQAYSTPRPRLKFEPLPGGSGEGERFGGFGDIYKPEREGFFFGSAAIDSYYAWLEHVTVLALPFTQFDPSSDDLLEFIFSSWSDKLKHVWDLNDGDAKRLYDALRAVKERFRNPSSHGGFEKPSASLYVHIPRLGAVPASLSKHSGSFHFDLYPLTATSFEEVSKLFDEVDAYFSSGVTKWGMRFVEWGLDVAFDDDSRARYMSAMASEEDFEGLIEGLSRFADMYANMDW